MRLGHAGRSDSGKADGFALLRAGLVGSASVAAAQHELHAPTTWRLCSQHRLRLPMLDPAYARVG